MRLFLIVLALAAGAAVAQEVPVEERIQDLGAKIDELFASEEESLEAIKELGTIDHPDSISLLEDLLIFRWETTDNPHGTRGRNRKRRLRQTMESMAKLRAKAAESLGKLGNEGSIPLLIKTVREDTDPVVREFALKALLNFNDPSILPAYEHTVISDELEGNRILGIVGMSRYPRKADAAVAKTLLNEENPIVRLGAIKFLAGADRTDMLPVLIAAAYDKEYIVRRRTADALGAYKTKSAAAALFDLVREEDVGVALSALISMGINPAVPSSEYIKLLSSSLWEMTLIGAKGAFNKWRSLTQDDFDPVLAECQERQCDILLRAKSKIECRQGLEARKEHLEKIKISLTERSEKGKL